jgi:arylsulfatase A-like enzyme
MNLTIGGEHLQKGAFKHAGACTFADAPRTVTAKFQTTMKSMTGKNRRLVALFLVALLSTPAARLQAQNLNGSRPNILVIITDDQRYDTIQDLMPRTQEKIFNEGVMFANAYVTTPLCSPSRSSILTGMYASRHGVRNNITPLQVMTFVERLQQSGYYTGLIGKYLNSVDESPKPGYDYWVGMPSDGDYTNPTLNINGVSVKHQGYLTYLLRDYAIDFLKKAATRNQQPFFLFFNPKSPHLPLKPAPADTNLYSDLEPYRPPNYNEADISDKPAWLRNRPQLSAQDQKDLDSLRQRQLQMLWSLDQSIDAIVAELKNQGQLDQTAIFYISDNGYFWGEHRLTGKVYVYEPASRVAFGLRYPPLAAAGKIENRLVANIDIAPTIYQLAGITIPNEVDGRSLLPLFQPQPNWRSELLLEAWPLQEPYSAVHTERYVYIENEGDRPELYDLATDPNQLQNSVDNVNYAPVVNDLKIRLKRLLSAVGDTTPDGPVPSSFMLLQNHPNPFRDGTMIRFTMQRAEQVKLQVFDLNGRLIATPINRRMSSGEHTLKFETLALPAGVYIYRLQSGAAVQQRKMVILQ